MDHLFYSEDEENFQLVLKPFVDIKKWYFETTLLEQLRLHSKCNYKTLPSAITARIAPYNHSICYYASTKKLEIDRVVTTEDKDLGLTEWKGFTYSAKGEPKDHHRYLVMAMRTNDSAVEGGNTPAPINSAPVQPVIARQDKDASIQRWANAVPQMTTRPLVNPMQELGKFGGGEATSGSTNSKLSPHLLQC